jgi:hypothetical protein
MSGTKANYAGLQIRRARLTCDEAAFARVMRAGGLADGRARGFLFA